MAYTHSKYQEAIFDFGRTGSGHAQVRAGAGSAKTYTGVELTRYFPRTLRGTPYTVFLAFNKSIQVELERKLEDRAIAKTYHSFGLSAIANSRRLKITDYKNSDLLKARFGEDMRPVFPLIHKIVGLFKGDLRQDVNHRTVLDYISAYDLAFDEEAEHLFDGIVTGVEYCMDPNHVERIGKIDFDDMIWYPLVTGQPIPHPDYLLVDEYQDTNFAQMELVFRAINGGRIFVIGDENQAIYHWRGAKSDAMQQFVTRTNCTILPLSITYRCPKAVVQHVNQKYPWIPFEAWDQAMEGSVNDVRENQMMEQAVPGDMVLCRLNAPLVRPAMRLLREGRKVIIKGKDIGQNMITLINQVTKKFSPTNLSEFLTDLDEYVRQESEKMRMTHREAQADMLEDKQGVIYAFSEGMDTVNDIKNAITQIYSNDQEGITFSSVHRAKGLEAPNVFILRPELLPFKRARTEEAKRQELNLSYVADTRCKQSLNYVMGG